MMFQDDYGEMSVAEWLRYLRSTGYPAGVLWPKSKTVLTPPQVAKQLGVKPATVVGWIKSGQLKAANLSKGVRPRFRVQPDDLKTFLDNQQPQQRVKSIRRTRKASRF